MFAPVTLGEKVTPIVQIPDAAIVFPLQVSLAIAYAPVMLALMNGRPTTFGLVNVSVSGPPVIPTVTLPNASGTGEPVGESSVPLPDSPIDEGLFRPSLVTCSVSEQVPAAVGAKFTPIVQVAGGGTGPVEPAGPRVVPVQPSLTIAIPQVLTRLTPLIVIRSGLGLRLLIVTVLVALVEPTIVFAKATLTDWLINPAIPFPVSVIVFGLFDAVEGIDSVPENGPTDDAVKLTPSVQLSPVFGLG